jgi:polysaccharide deacetylase family protein (PEP-CTERM system associated)
VEHQPLERRPDLNSLIFLTWDIEEWYHANYEGVDDADYRAQPTNLEALVDRIVDLCARHDVRTTCFVVGSVAEKKPGLIRKLQAAGHEIASHSYAHGMVHRMNPAEFRADLERSRRLLEDIAGTRIVGFRAPSFSVNREILGWFYEALEDAGIQYSSSVFPGRTFLYGVPGFPQEIHHPLVGGRRSAVLEIPLPLVRLFGHDMGLYVRLFPAWYIRRHLRKARDQGRPGVLYMHPREIDPHQPRLPLTRSQALIHYWGIASCSGKLEAVLGDLRGTLRPMRELVSEPQPQGSGGPA